MTMKACIVTRSQVNSGSFGLTGLIHIRVIMNMFDMLKDHIDIEIVGPGHNPKQYDLCLFEVTEHFLAEKINAKRYVGLCNSPSCSGQKEAYEKGYKVVIVNPAIDSLVNTFNSGEPDLTRNDSEGRPTGLPSLHEEYNRHATVVFPYIWSSVPLPVRQIEEVKKDKRGMLLVSSFLESDHENIEIAKDRFSRELGNIFNGWNLNTIRQFENFDMSRFSKNLNMNHIGIVPHDKLLVLMAEHSIAPSVFRQTSALECVVNRCLPFIWDNPSGGTEFTGLAQKHGVLFSITDSQQTISEKMKRMLANRTTILDDFYNTHGVWHTYENSWQAFERLLNGIM